MPEYWHCPYCDDLWKRCCNTLFDIFWRLSTRGTPPHMLLQAARRIHDWKWYLWIVAGSAVSYVAKAGVPRTVSFFYGVTTVWTYGTPWKTAGFLRCMFNRTVGNNCWTDNRTAPHGRLLKQYNLHRTAP